MTDKIRAPWTPEQVTALNNFQQYGGMHPFTCGNDQHDVSVVLMAHRDGWHCSDPACGYRQDWAHAFMANPAAWPKWLPNVTDEPTPSRRAGLRDEIVEALGRIKTIPPVAHRREQADHVLTVLYREWPWLRAEAQEVAPASSQAAEFINTVADIIADHEGDEWADHSATRALRAAITRAVTPTGLPATEPNGTQAEAEPSLFDKLTSMFSGPLPPPGDVPPSVALPCSHAHLRQPHDPHRWQPQPGMRPVQCPGWEHVPAAPDTVTDPAHLRDLYAAALYEHSNPGHRWPDAHPHDVTVYGADADAVLRVRDRHLEQLRQRLTLADNELQQRAATESADAAAGSYALRAEEAEAKVREYEHMLNWHTTCTNCARLLDSCYAETMRAETAEQQRDQYAALVRDFLDPDPCQFDHHGYCQAHAAGLGGEPMSCPHRRAREVLADLDSAALNPQEQPGPA